jgi:hypothetical protein
MTSEQAIQLAESKFWEDLSLRQRAEFQLTEDMLCMPFEVFHEAVEKTLGRPVYTHEFTLNRDGLISELLGDRPAPSLEEIINLIPAEKRIIVRLA